MFVYFRYSYKISGQVYKNMHPIWILFLAISFLCFSGCGANKKNSQKGENLTSAQDTVKTDSDTMPKPEPPPPGLPPGEAKVEGEIVEVENQTNGRASFYVRIRVDRVLGYGASTPPIGTADTLNVFISNSDQNRFKIGKIVSAVISYQQLPGNGGNSSRWALVTLENDSN